MPNSRTRYPILYLYSIGFHRAQYWPPFLFPSACELDLDHLIESHGLANDTTSDHVPQYVKDMLVEYKPRRRLRSSTQSLHPIGSKEPFPTFPLGSGMSWALQ